MVRITTSTAAVMAPAVRKQCHKNRRHILSPTPRQAEGYRAGQPAHRRGFLCNRTKCGLVKVPPGLLRIGTLCLERGSLPFGLQLPRRDGPLPIGQHLMIGDGPPQQVGLTPGKDTLLDA